MPLRTSLAPIRPRRWCDPLAGNAPPVGAHADLQGRMPEDAGSPLDGVDLRDAARCLRAGRGRTGRRRTRQGTRRAACRRWRCARSTKSDCSMARPTQNPGSSAVLLGERPGSRPSDRRELAAHQSVLSRCCGRRGGKSRPRYWLCDRRGRFATIPTCEPRLIILPVTDDERRRSKVRDIGADALRASAVAATVQIVNRTVRQDRTSGRGEGWGRYDIGGFQTPLRVMGCVADCVMRARQGEESQRDGQFVPPELSVESFGQVG